MNMRLFESFKARTLKSITTWSEVGQQIGSTTSRCSRNEPALPLERTAEIKPRQQTARAKKVHYNLIKM